MPHRWAIRPTVRITGLEEKYRISSLCKLAIKKFQVVARECPRGVMVKAMVCGIVVSAFVLQSRYYVHFRANTLGNGMNTLILPAMG